MKKIISLFLFGCQLAFPFNAYINCANTNIAQTYSTGTPSLPASLTNVQTPYQPAIYVINNTPVRICFNTLSPSTAAPTAGNGNEHCLIPNYSLFLDALDTKGPTMSVYVRSDLTTCTSGTVDITVW